MRAFQQLIVLLFALVASVVAQEPTYVATTTLTSTIQVVLTATVSPGASSSSPAAATTPIYSVPANTTMVYPTASAAPSSPPVPSKPTDFPGAASGLTANGAFIAAVAAAVGLFAL